MQDNKSLLLTPFERNLEVWRQLWRTLERSDLVVQIVDARNPLSSRSEDLEKYVLELNVDVVEGTGAQGEGTSRPKKKNLLLINKSDLLTRKQREGWADYFEAHNIQYAFFSAANSTALQEERARRLAEAAEEELAHSSSEESESESEEEIEDELARMKIPKSGNKLRAPGPGDRQPTSDDDDSEDDDSESDSNSDTDDENAVKKHRGVGISTPGSDESERTRILSVLELEDLFLSRAPESALPAGRGPCSCFLLTRCLNHSLGRRWPLEREARCRSRRIPERRQVVDDQRAHRREEGVRLGDPGQDQALPDDQPLAGRPALRLPRTRLPPVREIGRAHV